MKKQGNLERFKALFAEKAETSEWHNEALNRQSQDGWRQKSAAIAIQVLRTLRSQKLSQKTLAERIEVSPQYINKIVKGAENLSLETITKLEKALGIPLMTIFVGEHRRVGASQFNPSVSVDYYLGSDSSPVRVSKQFVHFSRQTMHCTA
jgi:ribosome-binding protein aMBF1 (putative translation factor)